tara:strand:+ start:131 stop:433 length:303 start_codon:yes stop_codon:yes gene_type:complete
VVAVVEMKAQQQQLFKEQMEDLVAEDLPLDQLQNLVVQEILLLSAHLKEMMVVQVMDNQESLEQVVAVVELVVQELTQWCQEIVLVMVVMEQQTILQGVV